MQLFENDRTHHYRNQTANEIYPKSFRLRFFNLEFVQPITIPGAKASFPSPCVPPFIVTPRSLFTCESLLVRDTTTPVNPF